MFGVQWAGNAIVPVFQTMPLLTELSLASFRLLLGPRPSGPAPPPARQPAAFAISTGGSRPTANKHGQRAYNTSSMRPII